jgi:hypothetical protein
MAKQLRHTQLKRRAAGPSGTTEKRQRGRTRLDARRGGIATEIERSGRIAPALNRLAKETNARKILRVPQNDLDRAAQLARKKDINVTITNLKGTRRRRVNS